MSMQFWKILARELEGFLASRKAAADFVGRFYGLVEERPCSSSVELVNAFEDFHYKVAMFEPDPVVRGQDRGLLDENSLLEAARSFLTVIKKEIY